MVCRLALAKEQTGREAHINNSFLLLFRWDGQSSCASVVGDWCACPDLSDRTFRFTAPENCHRSAKIRTKFSQTLVSRFCSADTFKSPENTFYSFPSVLFIITFCEREKEKNGWRKSSAVIFFFGWKWFSGTEIWSNFMRHKLFRLI